MAKIRADLIVLTAATVAWAIFVYSGLLVATFWWVAPAITFAVISTLVVCNLLESRPISRPFLSLIPPLVTLPYLALRAAGDSAFGLLPIGMLAWPAIIAAGGYLAFAATRHKV